MKSESIKELATALAKAQGQYKGAVKSATNPHYKSKYANLEADIECIKEPFSSNGLSFTQSKVKGEPYMATRIMHSSGEWIESYVDFVLPPNASPQVVKSATTYAKRNGLEAAAGIPSTDDDGEAAEGRMDNSAKEVIDDAAKRYFDELPPFEDLPIEKKRAEAKTFSDNMKKPIEKPIGGHIHRWTNSKVNPKELFCSQKFPNGEWCKEKKAVD